MVHCPEYGKLILVLGSFKGSSKGSFVWASLLRLSTRKWVCWRNSGESLQKRFLVRKGKRKKSIFPVFNYIMEYNGTRDFECTLIISEARSWKDHKLKVRTLWYTPLYCTDSILLSELQTLKIRTEQRLDHNKPFDCHTVYAHSIVWTTVSVQFVSMNSCFTVCTKMQYKSSLWRTAFTGIIVKRKKGFSSEKQTSDVEPPTKTGKLRS